MADERDERPGDPGDGPEVPGAGDPVFQSAYREAMERMRDRPSSLSTRTPEQWAELERVLMTDAPINLGDPGWPGRGG